MFKFGSLCLTGPICTCDHQNLEWGTTSEQDRRLFIRCKTCRTELSVPYDKFRMGFKLEKPYPAGLVDDEPAKILHLVPKLEDLN